MHGFVAFVLFVQSEAFLPAKILAHFSLGVNVMTLNKYMIKQKKKDIEIQPSLTFI